MDNYLKSLANGLINCYEEAYNIYKNDVDTIINNKIDDINYIERTLDYIFSIYTEKGFYLYLKLLLYYRTVNYDNAIKYLEFLKEERAEEYNDFVKKKVKL